MVPFEIGSNSMDFGPEKGHLFRFSVLKDTDYKPDSFNENAEFMWPWANLVIVYILPVMWAILL